MNVEELSRDALVVAAIVGTVVFGGFLFFALWGVGAEFRRRR